MSMLDFQLQVSMQLWTCITEAIFYKKTALKVTLLLPKLLVWLSSKGEIENEATSREVNIKTKSLFGG
jgi:hypothetical protein